MMLLQATRRLSTTGAAGRRMSTVAATTVSSDVQSYVTEAPAPTVTTLDNGVVVASLFSSDSVGTYTTTRVSGVGSRYDKVGGESAILARSLGGSAGREFITVAPNTPLFADVTSEHLAALKSNLTKEIEGSSYESQMMDHLHSTAYQNAPSGNSLGSPLVGSAESLASVTAGDVSSLLSSVVGSNVVVVSTGKGEHDKLVEEANATYGKLGSGGSSVGSVGEAAAFIGSDVRIRYDSHSNATIALGFEGASWTDPKAMPLALMQTILGSYTTSCGLGKNVASAMCQEVADHDLAASISAFNLSYSDTGLFGIVATAPDNKLDDLLWYVMPNMVRLAHGTSDEEFARAKIALKTQILDSYDGDAVVVGEIAQQLQTTGRVMSLAEMIARVDALTMDDVKAAANDVINDQDHALAAIGGIHELPDYNWIRRHSYMLRY